MHFHCTPDVSTFLPTISCATVRYLLVDTFHLISTPHNMFVPTVGTCRGISFRNTPRDALPQHRAAFASPYFICQRKLLFNTPGRHNRRLRNCLNKEAVTFRIQPVLTC